MSKAQKFLASRRSFLKAVGASAAMLPFFRLLERSALGDSPAGPINRLVLFTSEHGRAIEFWRPGAGFAIHPSSELQVFDDATTYGVNLKSQLNVIDGLDLKCAYESSSNGHTGYPSIWTGSNGIVQSAPVTVPKCESIDYFLAITNNLGAATAFPLVSFGARDYIKCHGLNGAPQSPYQEPSDLFNALFANFTVPGNPSSNGQAAADALARGKSTLDYIMGSITSLQTRLSAPEKAKLDQHLTSIRQIENRLVGAPGAVANASCAQPSAPVACNPVPDGDPCGSNPQACYCEDTFYNWQGFANYSNDTVNAIMFEALNCDLTRFANIETRDNAMPLTDISPPILGQDTLSADCSNGDCIHNAIAHQYKSTQYNGGYVQGGNASDPNLSSQQRLARAKKYHMSYIADMASKLQAAGLLGSTLIASCSDIGDPSVHDSNWLPFITVGNVNGYFKTGQHVLMPNDFTDPNYVDKYNLASDPEFTHMNPHNAMLTMIVNAFGVPVTSYGVSTNGLATTQGSAALLSALSVLKA
jgi:hypothetical protein